MANSECQIERWNDCCCTCKWRYIDRSHPCTDGKTMSNTRGYICAEPFLGYISGWGEHGICECWLQRLVRPEDDVEAEIWDARYTKRDAMPTYWRLMRE